MTNLRSLAVARMVGLGQSSAIHTTSQVLNALHLVVCCVGEFTPSGYNFTESFQVAEMSCWLERSIFASSWSLADCAVETTEVWQMLPILAYLGRVRPGYSSLKAHIVIG